MPTQTCSVPGMLTTTLSMYRHILYLFIGFICTYLLRSQMIGNCLFILWQLLTQENARLQYPCNKTVGEVSYFPPKISEHDHRLLVKQNILLHENYFINV